MADHRSGSDDAEQVEADLGALAATLREELERTTVNTPAIFDLPIARLVHLSADPQFAATEGKRCHSKARYEWEPPGSYYRPTTVQRWVVRCRMELGHSGPHQTNVDSPHWTRHTWLEW